MWIVYVYGMCAMKGCVTKQESGEKVIQKKGFT